MYNGTASDLTGETTAMPKPSGSVRRKRLGHPPHPPHAEGLGGLTRRLRSPGFHEAEHRLLQLRIDFVCDGHHVEQHGAEIHASKIVLKSIKDADLQDSRLFHHHGDSVALLASQNPMLACGIGNGTFGSGSETQAAHD